jgi:hypothetical protein
MHRIRLGFISLKPVVSSYSIFARIRNGLTTPNKQRSGEEANGPLFSQTGRVNDESAAQHGYCFSVSAGVRDRPDSREGVGEQESFRLPLPAELRTLPSARRSSDPLGQSRQLPNRE